MTPHGPGAVDPINLNFLIPSASGSNEGTLLFTGYVDFGQNQHDFNIEIQMDDFSMRGVFDDSGYPETLGISLQETWWWDSGGSTITLVDTTFSDISFELRLSTYDTWIEGTGSMLGEPIPEPGTVLLLGLGTVMARKRK